VVVMVVVVVVAVNLVMGNHLGQNVRTMKYEWYNAKPEEGKLKSRGSSTIFLNLNWPISFKAFFLKLFISNQNYIEFYKLICCDSV
jgi:hypothetical protein